MSELKEITSSIKSINNSLRKMADNTISRSCVNIELTYSPREIDRVLFAGDIEKELLITNINGDPLINESIIDFLDQEGLITCYFRERKCFKLTRRGYTLKHFGGFSELWKKENARIKRQEYLTIALAISGWIFAVIAAGFGAWMAR